MLITKGLGSIVHGMARAYSHGVQTLKASPPAAVATFELMVARACPCADCQKRRVKCGS